MVFVFRTELRSPSTGFRTRLDLLFPTKSSVEETPVITADPKLPTAAQNDMASTMHKSNGVLGAANGAPIGSTASLLTPQDLEELSENLYQYAILELGMSEERAKLYADAVAP